MHIRELADCFGLTLRAIRFYEEKGLLSPVRTTGGFTHERRTYSENDAFRIAEILRGARFGLSLREIKQYLVDGPTGPFLDMSDEVVERLRQDALRRYDEAGKLVADLNELKAARKAAGAFPGEAATTASPEVVKRASAGAR